MNRCIYTVIVLLLGTFVTISARPSVLADEPPSRAQSSRKKTQATIGSDRQSISLISAIRDGLITVRAKGTGDGRMTLSVTNRTRRLLRVVLPPGIVAQSATGQFGGMGGMGGGMMGGMGGMMGGMGGMMGGMGGGMMGGGMGMMGGGGMGGGGMMGGMGSMGQSSGTMPATMGMMTLSRTIMYFCGDPDSWDMRSLMIGMMGGMGGGMGMMGGGMGGMGGGMMGGMGGGGMRSVPPTDLPSADLKPKQTRHLPTRLVSLSQPDPNSGLQMPAEGEPLQIAGDVARLVDNHSVQKALKRLTAHAAPSSITQLAMWRLGGDLDWDSIAQLSDKWANRSELTWAQYFVEHLETWADGESGSLFFDVRGTGGPDEPLAAQLCTAIEGKTVLGLTARIGMPESPNGPGLACRATLDASNISVQVFASDELAQSWAPYGKFTVPVARANDKIDVAQVADAIAEGTISRVVRGQLIKGQRQRGKQIYGLRIENASPMILNGLAAMGTAGQANQSPKVLAGISIAPRRSMTVPVTQEIVKLLGLKQGIRLVALDLSGL